MSTQKDIVMHLFRICSFTNLLYKSIIMISIENSMIGKIGIFFVLRSLYTNKEEAIILQMTITTAIYNKFYKGNT